MLSGKQIISIYRNQQVLFTKCNNKLCLYSMLHFFKAYKPPHLVFSTLLVRETDCLKAGLEKLRVTEIQILYALIQMHNK